MRGAVAALLLLLAVSGAAAQSPPPGVSAADRAAIRGVITRQLDAFRRDDAAGAYAFAAPTIREKFTSPGAFLDMVRRAYPPVHRSREAEFSGLSLQEGEIVQEVELIGPDGRAALALYTMQRDASGAWVIAGCRLMASARLGV